jgi:hypothetical protein
MNAAAGPCNLLSSFDEVCQDSQQQHASSLQQLAG